MNKSVLALLVVSLAVNGLLWKRLHDQKDTLRSGEAAAAEAQQLRQQLQELEAARSASAKAAASDAGTVELARLRNEIGQLRQQLKEAKNAASVARSWRQLPPTADWSEKFAMATNELAREQRYLEQAFRDHDLLISNLAAASPQDLEDLKRRAQSRQCITNLKKIGLAARVWSIDHGEKFPADYVTMREELESPAILFCPAAPGTAAGAWSQLNPAAITYTWHGATADERKAESVLTTCPIHGHIGLADGSVQQTRPVPGLP